MSSPLFDIPREIIVYLSLFLPQKCVLHLGQTCRRLAKILFREETYHQRLKIEYPKLSAKCLDCDKYLYRLRYQRLNLIHNLSVSEENFVQPIRVRKVDRICLIYPVPPFAVEHKSRYYRIEPDVQIWSDETGQYHMESNRATCSIGLLPMLMNKWDDAFYPGRVTSISTEDVSTLLKKAAEAGYGEAPIFDGMCTTIIPNAWVEKYPTCFVVFNK